MEDRVTINMPIPHGGDTTDTRPIASGSWKSTFAGGIFKLLIAALALSLPLVEERPLPLWVGGMLLAGGLAELAVGWVARHSVVGKVALGSGTMTVLAGLFFMVAVRMGLAQLTVLTIVWLVLRGLASGLLALRSRSSLPARTLLLVRGATDTGLGIALIAGLSLSQIALMLFGGAPAMATGFLVIVAISFGVAGVGLIVIAMSERTWEQTHAVR
jgi:uncharacterized membrane protein HdeD (DUF308 family)